MRQLQLELRCIGVYAYRKQYLSWCVAVFCFTIHDSPPSSSEKYMKPKLAATRVNIVSGGDCFPCCVYCVWFTFHDTQPSSSKKYIKPKLAATRGNIVSGGDCFPCCVYCVAASDEETGDVWDEELHSDDHVHTSSKTPRLNQNVILRCWINFNSLN